MSEKRSTLDSLINTLCQERDELKLKMHLAEMEGREEYERLSEKVDELTTQYDPVKEAVIESTDNIVAALSLAAGEMVNGFRKVREAIKED